MVMRGEFGRMVALRGRDLTTVAMSEVAGKQRKISLDHEWIKVALSMGTCLGNPTSVALDEYVEI